MNYYHKYNAVISILVLLIFSCAYDEPEDSSGDFFPLKVGNTWYYSHSQANPSKDLERWMVVGQRKIQHKNYFLIESANEYRVLDTLFFYKNHGKLYRLFIGKSKKSYYLESLYADFTVSPDEVFYSFFTSITGKDEYYKVSVKTFTKNSVTFYYDNATAVDEENSITFTEGVGITKFYGDAWGISSNLVRVILK